MTETHGVSAQDENQRAFLRYLPKRIAAFERRILRYRIDGWDPAGMSVLGGDVRRLADASGHYELIETRQHLLVLAQMIGEHFASMRAPDPQQVKRMFALLSAVSASVASRHETEPRSAPVEKVPGTDEQHDALDAARVDAKPARDVEPSTSAADGSLDTTGPDAQESSGFVADAEQQAMAEPVETCEPTSSDATVETAESVALIEPSEPTEPFAPVELLEPADRAESTEPAGTSAPTASSVATTEPCDPVESFEPMDANTSVQPSGLSESAAPRVTAEPEGLDEPDATDEVGMRRVYHLSDGNPFASELGQRLESEGYAIEPVESVDELSELLLCLMPQVLLVDASHVPELAIIGALRRDTERHSQPQRHIQMVVTAAQDNLETRRAAHRAGADLLLFPPFEIGELSDRLQALHSSMAAEKVRVLIVDDNRSDALFARTVLNRAGMQAAVEHDPMRVLESLKSQRPDLVLMDLHMPFANGVEVTMLIREHPVFARLPIVFLSGESDPDSRLEAINAGGDDFLFKPIRPGHLIAAVRDRVRRMHPVNRQSPAGELPDEVTAD